MHVKSHTFDKKNKKKSVYLAQTNSGNYENMRKILNNSMQTLIISLTRQISK